MAEQTGRPLALTITPAAALRIRQVLAAKQVPEAGGLRLFVSGGGVAGYRYGLAVSRRAPDEGDVTVSSAGARVIIDYGSAELLAGSELDYIETPEAAGFTILNPAGLHACAAPV
jgi:iron-sulfur cluster assembly accessory protein